MKRSVVVLIHKSMNSRKSDSLIIRTKTPELTITRKHENSAESQNWVDDQWHWSTGGWGSVLKHFSASLRIKDALFLWISQFVLKYMPSLVYLLLQTSLFCKTSHCKKQGSADFLPWRDASSAQILTTNTAMLHFFKCISKNIFSALKVLVQTASECIHFFLILLEFH